MRKPDGQFEVLLLEENAVNDWWVMLRPGKRARIGTEIIFQRYRGEYDRSARPCDRYQRTKAIAGCDS